MEAIAPLEQLPDALQALPRQADAATIPPVRPDPAWPLADDLLGRLREAGL